MDSREAHRDPQETAALYLSGALTEEERRAVEAELSAGNEPLSLAIAELDGVIDALAGMVEPITPRPETRDTVLDALGEGEDRCDAHHEHVWDEWEGTDETSELYTLPVGEGAWEPTDVEGIDVRRLFVDRSNNRMTAMFRMAPGSEYVPHIHDGVEECYVLEGDLHVGEVVLRAGDYQRAPAGSTHGVQRTENGCVLLISSSLSDEMI